MTNKKADLAVGTLNEDPRLHIRLNPVLKLQLDEMASEDQITASALVRQLIARESKRREIQEQARSSETIDG